MATIDPTKFLDGRALEAIRTWVTTNYQPLNSNLTRVAGLPTSTTGLVKFNSNGTAELDTTSYAPLASPTFTGTVTLPSTVTISGITSSPASGQTTGLLKYTNGVLSIDTNTYLTSHRYRPISLNGTVKLANTSSDELNFVNTTSGNVVFQWRNASASTGTAAGLYANVDLTPSIATGGSNPVQLASNTTYTLTIGASGSSYSVVFKMPEISVFPSTTTANKVLLSTSTSGSVAWSSWSSAGFLKSKSDGSVEVDPTSYVPTTRTINGKQLSGNITLYGTDIAASSSVSTKLIGSDGKIPTSLLPDSITGSMEYKGPFDATSGSTISGLEPGWYYICSTAGTKNPDGTAGPSGGYEIGDWAVYNGPTDGWAKIDNSTKVSSVNGHTGAVTLNYSDVGAAASNHTHTTKIVTPSLPITEPLTLQYGTQYELQAGGTTFQFKMPARGTDNDHYPTGFTWTNGTTAGPTGSLTGNSGFSPVSFGAIPSASNTVSGVVTTGAQIFAGNKTFNGEVTVNNNFTVSGGGQGEEYVFTSVGEGTLKIYEAQSTSSYGFTIQPDGLSGHGTILTGSNNILKLAGTVRMDHVLTKEECTTYLNTGSWESN